MYCGYEYSGQSSLKALPPGTLLKQHYYLGRTLGIGGFGITYLAWDFQSRVKLAVKEYYPEGLVMRQPGSQRLVTVSEEKGRIYEHGLDNFMNEANILLQLQANTAVVNVLDFFTVNGTAYLVMEYLEGRTLSQHRRFTKRNFSVEEADDIIHRIGGALTDIHEKGLLHRDVSPDNIIYLSDGSAKLIDFGATRQFVVNETANMSVLVKPGFAPIEQYSRTGKQGAWTDVYALAATYYYIVTGRKPVDATDRFNGKGQEGLHELNPKVSPEVAAVIAQALEMNYTKRPQTMREFVYLLDRACGRMANYQNHLAKTRQLRRTLAPAGNGTARGAPYLYMVLQGRRIRKWTFAPGTAVTIGRRRERSEIVIEDDRISALHCQVYFEPVRKVFQVIDHSSNGTYTRTGLIGRGRYVELGSGDRFFLLEHGYEFEVEVRDVWKEES